MIRVHPRTVLLLVAPALALAALNAHAKGQLSAGQQVVDVDVAPTTQQQEDNTIRFLSDRQLSLACDPPTLSECNSATYAASTCGRFVAGKIRSGIANACNQQCGAPTLSQCGSDSFHRSLCGTVDAMRRAEPGPHVAIENPLNGSCTAAPGSCGELLCEAISGDQQAGDLLVNLFDSGLTVVPTFADPDSGNATADALSLEQNGYADPTNLIGRPLLRSKMTSFRATGNGLHYWSRVLRDQGSFIQSYGDSELVPIAVLNARNLFDSRREFYEANGISFNDCDEYVYEKYYDYSLFEDATRLPGITHREVFDVAYANLNANDGPRSAIASRSLVGIPLRMKEGVALPVALKFAEDKPQNVFFSFEMPSDADRQEAIDAWENRGREYTIEGAGVTVTIATDRPIFQRTSSGNDNQLILTGFPWAPAPGQEALFQTLKQRRLHDESFGWHGAANDRLAEYPDEVLSIYDRLKDEFDVLLKRRAAVITELHSLMLPPERLDDVFINDNPFDPGIYERFENPSDILYTPIDDLLSQQRFAREEFEIALGMSTPVERLIGAGAIEGQNLLGETAGMQNRSAPNSGAIVIKNGTIGRSLGFARDVSARQTGGSGFGVEAGLPEVVNADPVVALVQQLFRELVAIDAEIEVALLYAANVGCLDPVPANNVAAIGPCDWSPRDFAEAVDDQLLAERETDHQRCIELTGDDFGSIRLDENVTGRFSAEINSATDELPYPNFPTNSVFICDDPAYNSSVLRFERFKGCVDAWRVLVQTNIRNYISYLQGLLGDAKDMIDPTTGDVRPSQQTSSGDDVGDDTFGAGYDYTAGWAMVLPPENTPDNERFCALAPSVYATFDVRARIFGAEAEIVDAGLEAGIAPGSTNRASLELVGVSLIDVERTTTVDPARFNVLFSATEADFDEYFHASATFMVGPVPVTVSAGAGGVISATVEARGGDMPNGAGCANGDLALQGAFIPSYALSGFASAGVDALIVEVGVKIDLLLAGVSFPYTVTLNVEGGTVTNGRKDSMVSLNNDLDITLSFLGGRLSAYVEVCFIVCEEWDFTIFQWAPLKLTKNVFHETIKFSLEAMFELQRTLPLPTYPGVE